MKIAIVTGASSGLGAAFVRRLDALGGLDEIWGVARREGRMEALARELSTPMRAVGLDLTKPESVEELRTMLEANEPMGRKMDFLIQEVNRESNTIGSKCNDVAIAQVVVQLKAEVEKMREQVQNIE